MPLLLLKYWKPVAIIAAVLAVFYGGYHVRGAFDQITADRLLLAQVEAQKQEQLALEARAAQVEVALAAERAKSSDLQKRWSKINAQSHTVCNLSAPTLQLLHDATNPNGNTK